MDVVFDLSEKFKLILCMGLTGLIVSMKYF